MMGCEGVAACVRVVGCEDLCYEMRVVGCEGVMCDEGGGLLGGGVR